MVCFQQICFFRLVLQTKLVKDDVVEIRVSFKLPWVTFVSESKLLKAKLPTARIAR